MNSAPDFVPSGLVSVWDYCVRTAGQDGALAAYSELVTDDVFKPSGSLTIDSIREAMNTLDKLSSEGIHVVSIAELRTLIANDGQRREAADYARLFEVMAKLGWEFNDQAAINNHAAQAIQSRISALYGNAATDISVSPSGVQFLLDDPTHSCALIEGEVKNAMAQATNSIGMRGIGEIKVATTEDGPSLRVNASFELEKPDPDLVW